jgi:hypothetical protein
MLNRWGVSAMMTEYDGRNVSAVSFKMVIKGNPIAFKMPCNWRAVQQVLREQRLSPMYTTDEASIRVAWRIIHTWVKAQLALVEVNMTTIPQIFLPYAIMRDGRTLSEHAESDPKFLLGE